MKIHFSSLPPAGQQHQTRPQGSIGANDGWCPTFGEDSATTHASSASDWDSDEVRQIFAEMGSVHQHSQVNRHNIVMGAKQEVGRIHDEAAERSRATQAELSQLSRQASFGGMAGGFGGGFGGPVGMGSYYGASGVNTGVNTGTGSMLNNPMLNNPNIDDPNYLRTMTDSDLMRMGLDPMMVRMYCNNPNMYPGGLRSLMNNNGSFLR